MKFREAEVNVAELQRQAGVGLLLKVKELDDRVGDGKLLGVFRGAVEELEGARRGGRKINKKNQDLGEESEKRQESKEKEEMGEMEKDSLEGLS